MQIDPQRQSQGLPSAVPSNKPGARPQGRDEEQRAWEQARQREKKPKGHASPHSSPASDHGGPVMGGPHADSNETQSAPPPVQEMQDSHQFKEAARAGESMGQDSGSVNLARDQFQESKTLHQEEQDTQKRVTEAEEHEKKVAECQAQVVELTAKSGEIAGQLQKSHKLVGDVEERVRVLQGKLARSPRSTFFKGKLAVANMELVGARASVKEAEDAAEKVKASLEQRKTTLSQLKLKSPTNLAFLKVQADFAAYRARGNSTEAAEANLKQQEAIRERSAQSEHDSMQSIGQNLDHLNPARTRATWPDLVSSGLPRTEVERRLHALREKMQVLLPLQNRWDTAHRVLGS